MTTTATTRADARNRALRTLLQSLLVDVLIAVGAVGYEVLASSSDVEWRLLGLLLLKTVLTVLFSFLMRLKYDPLTPPMPDLLPPADPGPPAEPPQGLVGRSGGHPGHDYEEDDDPQDTATRFRRAVRPPVPPPDVRTPGYAAHAHPDDLAVESEADRQARRNEPG